MQTPLQVTSLTMDKIAKMMTNRIDEGMMRSQINTTTLSSQLRFFDFGGKNYEQDIAFDRDRSALPLFDQRDRPGRF